MGLSRQWTTYSGFSVSAQIDKLLNDYSIEMKRKTMNAIDQTAKEAAQQLKATSPVGKGRDRGEYAKGWAVKRQNDKIKGLATVTVHNKDHYQLTHLLEYGHDLPQGGRAKAQPHIEKVEQWAQGEVVRKIEEQLK